MIIEIPGRLPGFNEIIDAAKLRKRNYQAYSVMKDRHTTKIAWLAKKMPKYEKVALVITWYEPNQKRDPDNIMAGQKFILDGLVQAGVIPNDNQRHIHGILHKFGVDKDNPRIEVEIIDLDKPEELEGQEMWD